MTNSVTQDLLPCPFCGGPASVGATTTGYIVECNNAACEVNPDAFAKFKHSAIAAWNRRATIPPQPVIAWYREVCDTIDLSRENLPGFDPLVRPVGWKP